MTVLSLAITDILSMSCVCFPAVFVVFYDQYPLGKPFCYFWAFANLSGILATFESLLVISIERYIVRSIVFFKSETVIIQVFFICYTGRKVAPALPSIRHI